MDGRLWTGHSHSVRDGVLVATAAHASRPSALASPKIPGLLRQTDWTLTAIARAVGFAEARVLHRCFRQRTGTTPQRWRYET